MINTQGWVKGLGLLMLLDLIRYTRPTLIAQMTSDVSGRNLPTLSPLPDDSLFMPNGSTGPHIGGSDSGGASGGGAAMPLDAPSATAWKQQPARKTPAVVVLAYDSARRAPSVSNNSDASLNRNMALSAYFCCRPSTTTASSGRARTGLLVEPAKVRSLPLSAQQPYVVPFSAVGLSFTHSEHVPRSEILRVLNASIVGLMKPADDKQAGSAAAGRGELWPAKHNPASTCIGLGVVRAIDADRRLLYVLTPVDANVLHSCSVVARGNVDIPSNMLLHGTSAGGRGKAMFWGWGCFVLLYLFLFLFFLKKRAFGRVLYRVVPPWQTVCLRPKTCALFDSMLTCVC